MSIFGVQILCLTY